MQKIKVLKQKNTIWIS